eukprot:2527097-Pyramimonas_sp.AAC.1
MAFMLRFSTTPAMCRLMISFMATTSTLGLSAPVTPPRRSAMCGSATSTISDTTGMPCRG